MATIETLLRFRADEASLAAVDRAQARLAVQAQSAFSRVGEYGEATARRLENLYARIGASLRRATDGAQANRSAAPGRGAQSGVAERADRFGSIGSQIFGGLNNAELANAAGLIGDVGGAISSLGVAGGVAAISIGAVTVAFAEFNRQLQPIRNQLAGALTAQERYYDAILRLTTEQADARLAELKRQNALQQMAAEETRAAIASTFQQLVAEFGDPGARAAIAAGLTPITQLQEQLTQLETQSSATAGEMNRLAEGIRQNAFAANDAAEQLRLSQERINTARMNEVRAIAERARFEDQVSSAGRERAREMLREREREIEIIGEQITYLRRFWDSSEEARQKIEELQAQMFTLRSQSAQLREALEGAIPARERLRAFGDAIRGAIEGTIERAKQVSEALANIGAAKGRAENEIANVRLALALREAQIVQEFGQQRLRIEAQYAEAEIAARLRSAAERIKIERDFGRSILSAVARRDALAAVEARRQRADALDDLRDNDARERRERRRAYDAQLSDLQRNLNDQLTRERAAASAQINSIRARLDTEVRAQQQLIARALLYNQQRLSAEQVGYAQSLSVVTNFVTGVLNQMRRLTVPSTPGRGGGGGGARMSIGAGADEASMLRAVRIALR